MTCGYWRILQPKKPRRGANRFRVECGAPATHRCVSVPQWGYCPRHAAFVSGRNGLKVERIP